MRNKIRVALAAAVVSALAISTAAPAGAQEEPEALGFAVDKTQAQPGALVLGKADAADVAEHCVTDLQEFQDRWLPFLEMLLDESEGSLLLEFFPEDPGAFIITNYEQMAYVSTALVALGILINQGGAAETALPQTFVMTFADIATQDPVGERGNFDPDTGDGSVVVPDIEPGLWAVAAACVGPTMERDAIAAAFRQSAAFLEDIGVPVVHPLTGSPEFDEFIQDFLGDENATGQDFLAAIGPTLLEPIMVPDAFGAVLFCILDDQGNCPADEEPPGPPGEPIGPGDGEAGPAQPIVAAPSFTG